MPAAATEFLDLLTNIDQYRWTITIHWQVKATNIIFPFFAHVIIRLLILPQPSSNEVLSGEKSSATPSKTSEESAAKTSSKADTSLALDDDDDNSGNDVDANRDRSPMTSTSPKNGRQYITSFTTTTTVRPDLSRGVEIIRSLVEQARTTPPVPIGSVQSLTTLKTITVSKENTNQHREVERPTTTRTTTSTRSTTTRSISTTNNLANHRMGPMSSTTRRGPANHQTHDELIKSFTERPTTTTKTTQKSRDTVKPSIDINDIQDLLNKVPSTTPKATPRPTTMRPVRIRERERNRKYSDITFIFNYYRNRRRRGKRRALKNRSQKQH